MRRLVLASGAAAVVVLGGVPTAAVIAAGGHHVAGTPSSATAPGHHSDGKHAKEAPEARANQHAGPDSAHARRMVAIATTHRDGMRTWSACVRAAAQAGKADPTAGCVKPLPPGWVKHPDRHPAGTRPGSSKRD